MKYIPNLICLVVDGSIHWSSSPLIKGPNNKKKLANMLEPTSKKRNNSN